MWKEEGVPIFKNVWFLLNAQGYYLQIQFDKTSKKQSWIDSRILQTEFTRLVLNNNRILDCREFLFWGSAPSLLIHDTKCKQNSAQLKNQKNSQKMKNKIGFIFKTTKCWINSKLFCAIQIQANLVPCEHPTKLRDFPIPDVTGRVRLPPKVRKVQICTPWIHH